MTIVNLSDHHNLFQNLICIDVLLTNKCNLRCSYCFQQHEDNFGAYYTQESMRQTWDFLRDINNKKGKKLQFFGGEPMVHADFIREFVGLNADEFERQKGIMTTSIVTNGLLFTKDFLRDYLAPGTTEINFSIDTINPELCERGLSEEQIKIILDSVEDACEIGSSSTIAARMNITPENAVGFKDLFHALYERGMRRFWFHPLIHSFEYGMIEWKPDVWNQWRRDIHEIVDAGYDLEHFTVVEGVGIKDEGKDEFCGVTDIAMDGSGDFTSCYVWINQKEELLGNIFKDELEIDRYTNMKTEFEEMISTNEQCINCHRKNLCYQFSSGNKAVDGLLYRPDGLCQQLVDIYIETNERLASNSFIQKFKEIETAYNEEGSVAMTRAMIFLLQYYLARGDLSDPRSKVMIDEPSIDEINVAVGGLPDDYTDRIIGLFHAHYTGKVTFDNDPKAIACSAVLHNITEISARELYNTIVQDIDPKVKVRDDTGMPFEQEQLFYITMLHLLVLSRLEYFHAVAYGGYE